MMPVAAVCLGNGRNKPERDTLIYQKPGVTHWAISRSNLSALSSGDLYAGLTGLHFSINPHDRAVYTTARWIELKIRTTVWINQK